MNQNEITIFQNLWNAAKAVPKGKLIAVNVYIGKEEKFLINLLHLISETRKNF